MNRKRAIVVVIVSLFVLLLAYSIYAYRNRKILGPIIQTSLGKVQSILSVSREGKEFLEILGLPYARPPVGELRFESPQPIEKWEGVLDGTNYGPECAQLQLFTGYFNGKEDCLYLNVFVPKERTGPLPVMVWLHGGLFVTGSANAYRPRYFMDNEVILVTVNYRLAALGFLNTGDGVVTGNMGLKDQTQALKWVQQNIRSFGGDESKVTLFGESAGASAASFHVLSKMSKGLFSSAIMQSGVATSNWSVFKEPAKQAKRFAKHFDCPTEDTVEMVTCLKKVDAKVFVQAHEEILVPMREQITIFVPTLEIAKDDDTFLSEDPMKVLESGNFNKVNLIMGVNSDEGLLTSAIVTSNQTKLDQANDDYHFWAPRILNYPEDETEASDKIREFYFGDVETIASPDLINNYTNLFSDRTFFVPLHRFAKYYSKHAPLRLYYFAHRGQFSLSHILMATQKPYLPVVVNIMLDIAYRWVKTSVFGIDIPSPGVCHADDLPYFFDWPLTSDIKKGNRDYRISMDLVKMWTSFANEEKSIDFRGVDWEMMTSTQNQFKYLQITETPSMIDEPFSERVKFWDSIGL